MSKRKSSADLRHSFNAPGRRPSIANLQSRGILNTVHRKPGATNVRSTSSYRGVRSHVDTQRNSSNIPGTRKSKSGLSRNEGSTKIPKTRFNLTNGWSNHAPRLKCFPVESVRKNVENWSYSPPSVSKSPDPVDMCEGIKNLPETTRANTWTTNIPSHGYGDTLKPCTANGLGQQPRQAERSQQSPEQVVTNSQQNMNMPTVQNVSRINQSEAKIHGRIASTGQPHRPFVPITTGRNLTLPNSGISPRSSAQEGRISQEKEQQQQREQASLVIEQSHQVPQTSRQSAVNQLRHKIPWKVDDSPPVEDYEIQPIGGRNATTPNRVSDLVKKPEAQWPPPSNGHGTIPGQESQTMQHWANTQQQQQQPNQQQLQEYHQQQQMRQHEFHRQDPTRQFQSPQNAQQMYQQLRNNKIRQQELEQRASSQQQQIATMTQQQMRHRPLPHQLTMSEQINRALPYGNYYDQQQIYNGQLPNSAQGICPSKMMGIPHHQMLMQQRNAMTHRSLPTSQQHGWVHDHQVISDHPSLRGQLKPYAVDLVAAGGKSIPSDNVKRDEAQPVGNQHLAQQVAGIQWKQETPYQQYGEAMHQSPPFQHMQQRQQQYLPVQQERQVAVMQPQPAVIHNQQNQHQQQQVQISQHFDRPRIQRVSQAAGKKYPEFTAEMIRDQELLVTNMRQQKIPENIMRRQFDTLLTEQRRQLTFLSTRQLEDKINDTPPRGSSRTLYEDQRPDWMGRITPARLTIQPMQNSGDSLNQLAIRKNQEQRQTVLAQTKQYDQGQQDVSQHVVNDLQHSTTPSYQSHIPNRFDLYNSWQPRAINQRYGTELPASHAPFNNIALPHMSASPQTSFNLPQQNNGPPFNPQYHSVHLNDLKAHYQQQQPFQQQYQLQYQQPQRQQEVQSNQIQRMCQIQQQQSINCQQLECTRPEQQHEKMMRRYNDNLSQEKNAPNFEPGEPWSLLKLREFRKYIRPQRQNNGLQEAETVAAALEALKTPEAQKGLEYVAELGKKVASLKLNGTQDPSELQKIPPPPSEYLQRMEDRQKTFVSSNGLCNTRNSNNPASPPKSFPKKLAHSWMDEYPRQYLSLKRPTYIPHCTNEMIPEKENGSVARIVQQDHPGIVLPGYGQAMKQYSSILHSPQSQYPSHQFGQTNDQCQGTAIPCNGKNPAKPQGGVPIMPYKFDGSEPMYQQQMEQFYRNQLKLKSSDQGNITAVAQPSSTRNGTALISQDPQTDGNNTAPLKVVGPHSNDEQKTCAGGGVATTTGQLANDTYMGHDFTRMAENKKAVAQCTTMQQGTAGNDHGQPEIREPRTIGGLTYLARKVDYIQSPLLVAPGTLLASRFLQPLVGLN